MGSVLGTLFCNLEIFPIPCETICFYITDSLTWIKIVSHNFNLFKNKSM